MRSVLTAWLIALFALTSISAVSWPSAFSQGGSPIPVEAYWKLVLDTRQSVAQMDGLAPNEIQQKLTELAVQWEQIKAVELPDGNVLSVDSAHLAGKLRETPPDLGALEKSLDALLRLHEEYPNRLFTLADVEPLKEILARPEFQWDQGPAPARPEWLEKLLTAIDTFFGRLIYFMAELIYEGRILWMILAALFFLFTLFYISRKLSRSLVQDAQIDAENETDALLTSKGALQRAQSLSGQGDYRNAVRYLYLSSLLVLDEQGLLRYDRSRTNREYLRSVSSRPELATPLKDVIDVFDRVWYGFEPVDEETYQSYVKHVDELREKQE